MDVHALVLKIAIITAAIYGFTLFSWVLYVAAMHFAKIRHKLGQFAKINGYVVWVLAQPIDVSLNLLWSVILLDFPRELILSPKLKRLRAAGGWRGCVASFVCEQLLNPFDPDGKHC